MKKTNFIIISHHRCGTNLLKKSLQSHPELDLVGEIFNKHKKWAKTMPDTNTLFDFGLRKGGFIIHHSQVTPPFDNFWSIVKERKIKTIRLFRKNLLERYVSHIIANKTQIYLKHNNEFHKPKEKVNVNIKDMFFNFKEIKDISKNSFDIDNKINIYYEDLKDNFYLTIEKILEFLEVKQISLTPKTKKLETRPMSCVIENFDIIEPIISDDFYFCFQKEKEQWEQELLNNRIISPNHLLL